MYAVIIAVCNIRVFICIIIFKPALTNKVVNACPKNTTYISIQNIVLHHIYIYYFIYTYILLVCIYFGKFLKHPVQPSMEWWSIYCYILESRKGWLLQSTRFPALFSKRAPTTIHSITHSFPKSIDDVFGDYNRVVHSSTIIYHLLFS